MLIVVEHLQILTLLKKNIIIILIEYNMFKNKLLILLIILEWKLLLSMSIKCLNVFWNMLSNIPIKTWSDLIKLPELIESRLSYAMLWSIWDEFYKDLLTFRHL